jgi:hypothetical protein
MSFGGRKFVVTMCFGTAVCVLCWFGKMAGVNCAEVLVALSTLYKASNILDSRYGGSPGGQH